MTTMCRSTSSPVPSCRPNCTTKPNSCVNWHGEDLTPCQFTQLLGFVVQLGRQEGTGEEVDLHIVVIVTQAGADPVVMDRGALYGQNGTGDRCSRGQEGDG